MKIKNIFRKLVLIELALAISIFISIFFQSQEVINFNENYQKSISETFDIIAFFVVLVGYPVVFYLLYNFKSFGNNYI